MTNAGKRRALRSREPPQRLGESTRTDVARRTARRRDPGPQARPLMRPKTGPASDERARYPKLCDRGSRRQQTATELTASRRILAVLTRLGVGRSSTVSAITISLPSLRARYPKLCDRGSRRQQTATELTASRRILAVLTRLGVGRSSTVSAITISLPSLQPNNGL